MQMTAFRLTNYLIIIVALFSCSSTKSTKSEDPVTLLVREAQSYLGVPYKWGGNSKSGIDCSGLTLQAYKAINIPLQRTADAQALQGEKVKLNALQPGDLVFFTNEKNSKAVTHVGLVTKVERGDVIFINATRRGVEEGILSEEHWRVLYWGARRMVKSKS